MKTKLTTNKYQMPKTSQFLLKFSLCLQHKFKQIQRMFCDSGVIDISQNNFEDFYKKV